MSRYLIGIDLGTTNTALAYVDRREAGGGTTIRTFEVPQLVAPGEVRPRRLLPSSIYLPGSHELPPGALALPFGEPRSFAVGEFARAQGGRVPGRLVSSGKSWLCHDRVDRRAAILPWDAPEDVERISPVEAAARVLGHLRDAWDGTIGDDSERRFLDQEVVITVPASFDAVARQLTLEAANAIGLSRPLLLEEPQAALYAFIAAQGGAVEKRLPAGSLVLVVDVGGGTTDCTLVAVKPAGTGDGVVFDRVAVSDHLLLGGDNMDLGLARFVASRLSTDGGISAELDTRQWGQLRHACREAKEALLTDGGPSRGETPPATPPDHVTVTLAGSGTRLVGGSRSGELTRETVLMLVVEGFFPEVAIDDLTPRRSKIGLQEIGLPFVADPAVTRHLGSFLHRHADESGRSKNGLAAPTHVVFNGGVVTNQLVRDRILDVITSWTGERPEELEAESFDLAVARGAAYYAVIRRDEARRIRGGLGRAYYVGVDMGGKKPAALCLTPRGLEAEKPVAVRLAAMLQANVPVQFPFYFSSERHDAAGDIIEAPRLASDDEDGDLHELPPLLTVVRAGTKRISLKKEVPVELESKLTEIGTLEVACHATDGTDRRWQLELSVRAAPRIATGAKDGEAAAAAASEALDADRLARAGELIAAGFAAPDEPDGALKRLARALEELIGADRDAWPVAVCRQLWALIFDQKDARKKSAEHEARFWNLTAFCLRPGFGAALDDHRVSQMWKLALSGLVFPKSDACRLEWLIFQRRTAGGLQKGHHEQIFQRLLRENLLGRPSNDPRSGKRIPKQEAAEQWRLAASLEHLSPRVKEEIGNRLLGLLEKNEGPPRWGAWALGRIGARAPRFGPINDCVPGRVAALWARRLLPLLAATEAADRDKAIFAVVSLARRTGDPMRDVPATVGAECADALRALGADEAAVRPLVEVVDSAPPEQRLLFGDSVPTGLRIER